MVPEFREIGAFQAIITLATFQIHLFIDLLRLFLCSARFIVLTIMRNERVASFSRLLRARLADGLCSAKESKRGELVFC